MARIGQVRSGDVILYKMNIIIFSMNSFLLFGMAQQFNCHEFSWLPGCNGAMFHDLIEREFLVVSIQQRGIKINKTVE